MKGFLFSILLLNLVLLSINAQYPGYEMTVKSMNGSFKPLTEYINTDVYIPHQWVAVDNTGKPIFRRISMEGESDAEYYFNELTNEISKK